MTFAVNFKNGDLVFHGRSENGVDYECYEDDSGYTVFANTEMNLGTVESEEVARDLCHAHSNSNFPTGWRMTEVEVPEQCRACIVGRADGSPLPKWAESFSSVFTGFSNVAIAAYFRRDGQFDLQDRWVLAEENGRISRLPWEPTHWMYLPSVTY